jgi:cell division protein FtsN
VEKLPEMPAPPAAAQENTVEQPVAAGSGTTLSAEETVVTPPQASQPVTAGDTMIQVGAFSSRANAERAKAKLLEVQSHPVTITPVKGRYQVLQRVQIGPFESEAEALKLKDMLIELGFKGYRIISK